MAGETVVFLGNCQANALASVYRTYIAPLAGQNVIHVASYHGGEDNRRALDQADVVLVQRLDFTPEVTAGDLRPGVRRFEFPLVAAGFLWPHASEPHPANSVTQGFDGPWPSQLGDKFLNQMIKDRIQPTEAVERYLNLDIARHTNVDRRFELYMQRQRTRDSETGYQIAGTIERYLQDEYLFFTLAHPNLRIFREIFARVCDQLGAASADVERATASLKVTPFPKEQMPLHPGVIRHFGLRFANENTCYRHFNQGRYTFKEFVGRYMRHEYDADLEQAIRICLAGGDQSAIDRLRAGLRRVPRSAQAHHALSVALRRRGELDSAIAAIRTAIAIDPNEAHFHAHLGDLLVHAGEWDQAIVSFSLALEFGDRSVFVATNLARLRARTGDLAEAERQCRSVLDLDRNGACHEMLTHFLMQQNRIDEAMLTAQGAVALGRDNPDIRQLMSHLLSRAGNPEAAEAEMRIAVQLAPNAAGYHLSLSHILARRQCLDEAVAAARQAVELDGGNAHFRAHLGALLLRTGDVDGAEQELRVAIRLAPDDAHVHGIFGQILARRNSAGDAIATPQHAVAA